MKLQSTVLVFLSSCIWAFAFIPTRYLGSIGIGVFFEIFIRYLVPTCVLLLFFFPTILCASKQTIIRSSLAGATLWGALVLAIYGVRAIEYGSVGLLLVTLYVLFVPLFSFIIYRKPIPRVLILCVFVSFLGITLLTVGKPLGTPNSGTALCFIASILYASYLLLSSRIVDSNTPPITLHFYQSITAVVLSLPFIAIVEMPSLTKVFTLHYTDIYLWLSLLFTGFCSGLLAYLFLFYAQQYLIPTVIVIVLSTKNIIGALLDIILFNAPLTAIHYIAYMLVITATVVASLYSYRK